MKWIFGNPPPDASKGQKPLGFSEDDINGRGGVQMQASSASVATATSVPTYSSCSTNEGYHSMEKMTSGIGGRSQKSKTLVSNGQSNQDYNNMDDHVPSSPPPQPHLRFHFVCEVRVRSKHFGII